MHEWALAEGVVATALDFGEKQGFTRLKRIEIRIGELQRIDRDVFDQALKTVVPESEPLLSSTEFRLKIEPVRFVCRPCERRFSMAEASEGLEEDEVEAVHFIPELAHTFMGCPSCGSPDFEVVGGRGLWIEALEGE